MQSHEHNQRCLNNNICVSLIKKEIELFSGIIPFVKYNTFTYKLRNTKVQTLPKGYFIVELNNFRKYREIYRLLYSNADYCSKNRNL